MLVSREELLFYGNPAVVRRFQKEHPDRKEHAERIFTDLLLFFWATRKHELDRQAHPDREDLDFDFLMDEEMRCIDQMWHVFLQYTRDYAEFCQRYFGEFLHHQPDLEPSFEDDDLGYERNLERFLTYVYDHLGEKVVSRWFAASLATS